MIATVPLRFPGAGRRVYPGFMQITAFLTMNLPRHVKSHFDLYNALVDGDVDAARTTRDFYDEYFAVLDLTAEFYLETVERVFQTMDLARGEMTIHGRTVDPGGHHQDVAADRRGRARRHLLDRPDHGRPRPLLRPEPVPEAPPPPGRRRPLRRVLGTPVAPQVYPVVRGVIASREEARHP